jgi:FkbH-like protein
VTDIKQLLDWQRSGELADRYPQVRGLLAGLSPAELATAGRVLSKLDSDDLAARHPGTRPVSVAVTGHGTLAELSPALFGEFARHGLVADVRMAEHDSYVFDLVDPRSELYASKPDIVLCVLDHRIVLDELPAPWTPDDLQRVLDEKLALLNRLAAGFESAATGGTLVYNTLPLPAIVTGQLVDRLSRAKVGAMWRRANAALLDLVDQHPSLVVVDTDPLVGAGARISDDRMSVYAKAHLSAELLAGYAKEIGHLARVKSGDVKKALVLDLDGTLWGGILGDDGQEGIEIGGTYHGEAFTAFQTVVKQLGSQGILLGVVSKNDAEPVATVLREDTRMTLREDDFVRVIANWQPKHDNLRALAESLNIGVDSLVHVDDSPYEVGLVRHELPSTSVVALNTDPAEHVARLLADGWFDTRDLTAEDRARPARYREEVVRKDFLDSFESLSDYLSALGIRVELARLSEPDVARVSQITLRTNQFNLTTRRLQPADVQAFADDPDNLVLTVRAADRFGDNGLVGVLFARRTGTALRIDNFLLSCRVFSRGVEDTALAFLLRYAKDTGATEVLGEYQPSPKNGKVAGLYPRFGFTALQDGVFRHDLADLPEVPEHVTATVADNITLVSMGD